MTVQGDNPDKRTDAAELAAIQRNSVTVPADKLAELQRKAGMVDDLVEVLEDIIERWDTPLWKDVPHTAEYIDAARFVLAKAKEQSCSTLCHPEEEECFITESGKCEAKGE